VRLKFIREKDNETFEIGAYAYGPFTLDPNTIIPQATNLDVTGYEYSGRDGGYQTSSRLQRRPFDLQFRVREDWTTTLGLFELIRQAQRFFDPHQDNLISNLFTVEFYTNDKTKSSFMLRHGTISVPFGARTEKGEGNAQAQISFIFGDPYLYPIGESGVGITNVRLFAAGQEEEPEGRSWSEDDGGVWSEDDGKVWVTNEGGQGAPVAVNVVSASTVPVKISAYGQLVSPRIINLTNNSFFRYDGTLQAGDVLTVDTNGVVLLNGFPTGTVYDGVLTAKDGVNSFVLEAAPNSDGYADLVIRGAF
jgi:hypothetical protein